MASLNDHENRINKIENMYQHSITINGDMNTYYPVDITFDRRDNCYDNILTIYRNLGQQPCCPSYPNNHSNKTSSMVLTFELRLSGWDGNGNRCCVKNILQPYASHIANIMINDSSFSGIVIWLRGGGTIYYIKSSCDITANVRYTNTNISDLNKNEYPVYVEPTTTVRSLDQIIISGCNGKIIGVDQFYARYIKSVGDIAGNRVFNAVWNDYAEFFERGESTEVGDIIALDTSCNEERYIKATYKSTCVVGVHSNSFAHLIGGENPTNGEDFYDYNIKKYIPVGLAGRVMVKVKGPIKKGDIICCSEIAGVGRSVNYQVDKSGFIEGNTVGISLQDKTTDDIGLVKMLITK